MLTTRNNPRKAWFALALCVRLIFLVLLLASCNTSGSATTPTPRLAVADPTNHVHLFSVDPAHPHVFFLGLHSGTYRSTDAGKHWQLVEPSQDQVVITAFSASPVQPETLYALGFSVTPVRGALRGVLGSDDAGRSWHAINGDLPNSTGAFLVHAGHAPGEVFAFLPPRGLFRTMNSMAASPHWQQVSTTLPRATHALLADPLNPAEMLAVTDEGLYHGTKDGAAWRLLPGTPPNLAIALTSPRQPRLVYGTGLEGVYRSTDGARRFSVVNDAQFFQAIAEVAAAPTILYGADGKTTSTSSDGGKSWQALAPLPATEGSIAGVQTDSTNPKLIYAVTSLPVRFFASSDGGKTWNEHPIA